MKGHQNLSPIAQMGIFKKKRSNQKTNRTSLENFLYNDNHQSLSVSRISIKKDIGQWDSALEESQTYPDKII